VRRLQYERDLLDAQERHALDWAAVHEDHTAALAALEASHDTALSALRVDIKTLQGANATLMETTTGLQGANASLVEDKVTMESSIRSLEATVGNLEAMKRASDTALREEMQGNITALQLSLDQAMEAYKEAEERAQAGALVVSEQGAALVAVRQGVARGSEEDYMTLYKLYTALDLATTGGGLEGPMEALGASLKDLREGLSLQGWGGISSAVGGVLSRMEEVGSPLAVAQGTVQYSYRVNHNPIAM